MCKYVNTVKICHTDILSVSNIMVCCFQLLPKHGHSVYTAFHCTHWVAWLHLVNEGVPHHLNQQAVEVTQTQSPAGVSLYLENHIIIWDLQRIAQGLSYWLNLHVDLAGAVHLLQPHINPLGQLSSHPNDGRLLKELYIHLVYN